MKWLSYSLAMALLINCHLMDTCFGGNFDFNELTKEKRTDGARSTLGGIVDESSREESRFNRKIYDKIEEDRERSSLYTVREGAGKRATLYCADGNAPWSNVRAAVSIQCHDYEEEIDCRERMESQVGGGQTLKSASDSCARYLGGKWGYSGRVKVEK